MSVASQVDWLKSRISRQPNKWKHPDAFQRFMHQLKQEDPIKYQLPDYASHNSRYRLFSSWGMDVVCIKPQSERHDQVIVYFHGGGYVNQPNQFHLSFLEEISDRSRAIIYMPVYPKVPHFCALDAYEQLNVFYNHLLKEHPLCQMVWMGDSAGAGLALGLSMTFRDQSDPQPDTLILMSPWLDIRLSNPLSEQMERKDPMLGVYGLRKVGHMWGRGLDARDSRISPFYDEGNLSQLVYIIMGTNELFLPDAREFREKLRLQKVNLVYEEYRGMPHVFPLVNYPESKKARNRIIEILTLDK